MNFIDYTNNWAKSEVIQGKIMIALGTLLLIMLYGIFKSENELLKDALIPLGLLLVVLIGYGSYILNSRPMHAKNSISLYEKSSSEAIASEKLKHIN